MNIRDWLYVEDNCKGIDLVRLKGKKGEIYNIGGDNEHTNMTITAIILEELQKPSSLISFVQDRPGHDRRHSIKSVKLKKLGWEPTSSKNFTDAMKNTIRWDVQNEWWWKKLVSS